MRARIGKKAVVGHATDYLGSAFILFAIILVAFGYVGWQRESEMTAINSANDNTQGSRDLLVLMRTPLSDGNTVADHIIRGYLEKTLADPALKTELSQTIYRFFNTYYVEGDESTWTLTVSEEFDNGKQNVHFAYNRYLDLKLVNDAKLSELLKKSPSGSTLCNKNVKTLSSLRLPARVHEVHNLVISLKKCYD